MSHCSVVSQWWLSVAADAAAAALRRWRMASVWFPSCWRWWSSWPVQRRRREKKKTRDELHVVAVQEFSISQIHFKSVYGRVEVQWLHKQKAAAAGKREGGSGARHCANNNYHWQLRAPKMPTNETRLQGVHLYGCLCWFAVCDRVCACALCVCACVITLCALISRLLCSCRSWASLFARSFGQALLIANQLPLTLFNTRYP